MVVCDVVNTNSSLCHINLSGNNITNQAAEALSVGIAKNTILQHLELESCNLHGNGLKSICTVIKDKNLRTLNLNHNCITDQVADDLARFIIIGCIENLQLKGCSLKHNGIKVLIKSLTKIKSLKFLDLSHNRISDISLEVAAVISCNTNLEHLDLSYCELLEGTMIEMFETKCSILKVLNLDDNQICDSVADYMGNFICNASRLQWLSLSQCHLQENGLLEILKSKQLSLKYLNLSNNKISDKTAESVAKVICRSTNLEHLDLSNCQLQDYGFTLILRAVKSAAKLNKIDLKSNHISNILTRYIAAFLSNNHVLNYLSISDCGLQSKEFFLKLQVLLRVQIGCCI